MEWAVAIEARCCALTIGERCWVIRARQEAIASEWQQFKVGRELRDVRRRVDAFERMGMPVREGTFLGAHGVPDGH